jgi:hypothetical protein
MKWTVDQSHLPAFVSVETSGDPEPKDFVSMWREILSSEFWRPGIPVLVDNQKLKPMKDPDAFPTMSKASARPVLLRSALCLITLNMPANFSTG